MYILVILTNIYVLGTHSLATSPNITSIELSSKERCIKAAEFTKKQANIANAFCIQK